MKLGENWKKSISRALVFILLLFINVSSSKPARLTTLKISRAEIRAAYAQGEEIVIISIEQLLDTIGQ